MSKKDFLLIGFFFVAALVAWILNIRTEKKVRDFDRAITQSTKNSSSNKTAIRTEKLKINATVFEVMERNEPLRCVYVKVQDGVTKSNTMYTDGTNARSNTRTKSISQEFQVNTVIKQDIVYIWQPGDAQGMQMDLKRYRDNNNNSDTSITSEPMQLEERFDFECDYWQPVPSMFETPYNFKFIDITDALFKINETPCLICDSMTDPTRKAECKTSLKCK